MATALNLDQNSYRKTKNRRGYNENIFRTHLHLEDLKNAHAQNEYLWIEDIPRYPRPEFHVTRLKHDTTRDGLRGIYDDEGFKDPYDSSLLWWSLKVGSNEINSAGTRLLKSTFPNLTEMQAQTRNGFLKKFTTSPAFMESSRLGSYRFTFPLEEVLGAYSHQFCDGARPMMRAFRTSLYKVEVMYTVLVHSPADEKSFSDYPLLDDVENPICTYKDGCIVWWPEAMCAAHNYKLVERCHEQQLEAEEVPRHRRRYYVWDHVSLALHVGEKLLKFDANSLRENLKFCDKARPAISRNDEFDNFEKAKNLVSELWPDSPALERAEEDVEDAAESLENSLQIH